MVPFACSTAGAPLRNNVQPTTVMKLLWMSKSGGVFQFSGGRMTSRGQCPRGGACECPRVGVFFNFPEGEWRHADNVQGGGGACEIPCEMWNFGQSTPLPLLTKAFPYAYGQRVNTGESYIYYFGIFICGGTLNAQGLNEAICLITGAILPKGLAMGDRRRGVIVLQN